MTPAIVFLALPALLALVGLIVTKADNITIDDKPSTVATWVVRAVLMMVIAAEVSLMIAQWGS